MSDSQPQLVASPQLREISHPKKQNILQSDTYIHSLAQLPTRYAALTSSPSSDVIHLFDRTTLTSIQRFEGHKDGSTCLRAVENFSASQEGGKMLISSGKDGLIKVWDERANSCTLNLSNPAQNRPILSFDVSSDGLLVAGGTALQGEDALILYWDPRKPAAPIRTHSSTHSDDITALHFRKDASSSSDGTNLILSASSDGLISTSNADEDDEDEAVLHVANWGCSVSQVGWVNSTTSKVEENSAASIWAASDMETFSTWTSELDPLQSLDLRLPVLQSERRTWVTDYLIACDGNERSNKFTMFMGTNEGDIAQVTNEYLGMPRKLAPQWTVQRVWSQNHQGIVRSVLWDNENGALLTGGEDGKLTLWSGPTTQHGEGDMDVDESSTRSPVRSKREHDDDMDVDDGSSRKRRR